MRSVAYTALFYWGWGAAVIIPAVAVAALVFYFAKKMWWIIPFTIAEIAWAGGWLLTVHTKSFARAGTFVIAFGGVSAAVLFWAAVVILIRRYIGGRQPEDLSRYGYDHNGDEGRSAQWRRRRAAHKVAYFEHGNLEEKTPSRRLRFLDRLKRKDPGNPEVRFLLSKEYSEQGEKELARHEILGAIRLHPANLKYREQLEEIAKDVT